MASPMVQNLVSCYVRTIPGDPSQFCVATTCDQEHRTSIEDARQFQCNSMSRRVICGWDRSLCRFVVIQHGAWVDVRVNPVCLPASPTSTAIGLIVGDRWLLLGWVSHGRVINGAGGPLILRHRSICRPPSFALRRPSNGYRHVSHCDPAPQLVTSSLNCSTIVTWPSCEHASAWGDEHIFARVLFGPTVSHVSDGPIVLGQLCASTLPSCWPLFGVTLSKPPHIQVSDRWPFHTAWAWLSSASCSEMSTALYLLLGRYFRWASDLEPSCRVGTRFQKRLRRAHWGIIQLVGPLLTLLLSAVMAPPLHPPSISY